MAIAFAVLALGGISVAVLGWLGLQGRLRRNAFAGIRTPYTMRSEENWYVTHRHGAPPLIFGGVAVAAGALAFLPFALAGVVSDELAAAAAIALAAVLLVSVLGAWLTGTRRARAAGQ
jgi:uncharacterized membrane protein